MSKEYLPLEGTSRQRHEAMELAKLAVELCRLEEPDNPDANPEAYLDAALELVLKAREVIKDERAVIKKEPADD